MSQRPPRPRPPKPKGTVTRLSSVFPPEEAQKASQRVQDTLSERRKQVDQLREFISDNASIVNLVQRLPDELHHNIMVPFGKAAFFPGKLIHTNEFLVLLGEGYYAERTSNQTVDILKRRGKDLETQLQGVKAVMQDLEAEASFFNATAAEAGEDFVDITELEDYPAEGHEAGGSESNASPSPKAGSTSDELTYEDCDRICDKLIKEEEEAENDNEDDEDEGKQGDLHHYMSQDIISEKLESSEVHQFSDRVEHLVPIEDHSEADKRDRLHVKSPERLASKDGSMHDKGLSLSECGIPEKAMKLPQMAESGHASSSKEKVSVEKSEPSVSQVPVEKPGPSASSSKAFTGTIVERTPNIGVNAMNQNVVGHSSKPVSRFKLQRK